MPLPSAKPRNLKAIEMSQTNLPANLPATNLPATNLPASNLDFLAWPFFAPQHRALAEGITAWAAAHLPAILAEHPEVDQQCRALVAALGEAGWLKHVLALQEGQSFDTRSLCLLREILASHAPLADFALAMQGLGSAPLSLFGTDQQRALVLPKVAKGEAVAAFALSEENAGSDVLAMQCSAQAVAGGYVLQGEKLWISNGGIADFYIIFAREVCDPQLASRPKASQSLSAFLVMADNPGLHIAERIHMLAPHPMARLQLRDCFVPTSQLIGSPGQGFAIAMASLDVFRSSVAAAALGMARSAYCIALAHVRQRQLFGGVLADLQITQAKLAEMAVALDTSSLLIYRAAWWRDQGNSVTKEAAMAKWHATEQAQMVVDHALQLLGAQALVVGHPLEKLYRDIRALRIYEGASEVQQVIIARQILKN